MPLKLPTHCKSILAIIALFCSVHTHAQLKAAFSATPPSSCTPLYTMFTDESTGNPTSWKWDLGNGVISTLKNPTTTYFTPGNYAIKLVIQDASGTIDSITKEQYITVYGKPDVTFTASDTVGCYPMSAQFTDQSTATSGNIVSWYWDFGDGVTSMDQNPFHTYKNAANFDVTLQVTNSFGCVTTFSKGKYIQVSTGVKGAFTTNATGNCKPPAVITFTNTTTGPGTLTYNWDFGDGNTSTESNPTHSYTSSGTYTVTLITLSSSGCSDTLKKANFISIGTVSSSFTAPSPVCVNDSILFNNTSTPAPGSSLWNFGDGSTDTLINPKKVYSSAGTYTVKLTNNFGSCKDSVTQQVQVVARASGNFAADDSTSCSAPFTVHFKSTTQGAVKYFWDLGDGTSSTEANPTHTYNQLGAYTINLTITNSSGCTTSIIKQAYIVLQKPTIAINGLPVHGCIPFTIHPTTSITTVDPIKTYSWDFGDGSKATTAAPEHTYSTAGTYTVKLTVTTTSGCSDSLIITNAVRSGTKPTPNFSATPTTACVGAPIQFTDQSVKATEWSWFFGDLNTSQSNSQNPAYTFSNDGTFTIKLIVGNNGCMDSIVRKDYIIISPPTAAFGYTFDCSSRLTRTFIDSSSGAKSWSWDFGDNSTSTDQSPTHTYTKSGSYKVTQTVTNGACKHSISKTINVILVDPSFTVSQNNVCKKTQIKFLLNNYDATYIKSITWNYGDGTSNTTTKSFGTTHSYSTTGTFTPSITILDFNGCDTTYTLPAPINVYGPTASFKLSAAGLCISTPVVFTDLSTTDNIHPISTWTWSYGDGQIETLTTGPFQHQYTFPGWKNITLVVKDSYGCQDSLQKNNAVYISKPVAAFMSPDSASCTNKTVRFIDSSSGIVANTKYLWDFGDATTSTTANPTHAYKQTGIYTVKLTVTDPYGCTSSVTKQSYIHIVFPTAAFTVSADLSNCPPLHAQFTNQSANYKSVLWDFGDGNTSTEVSPSHFYTYPGVYVATLTTTSDGGCTATAQHTMTVRGPTGTLTYSPTIGCNSVKSTFNIVAQGASSFIWDFGDGNTIKTASTLVSHSYSDTGSFVPKIILIDATGCNVPIEGEDTIHVFKVVTNFSIGTTKACNTGSVQFTDSTITNDKISSYLWNFGDNTTSDEANPLHQYTLPGTYSVRLTVTTQGGCSNSIIYPDVIQIFAAPVVNVLGNTPGCAPAELTFTADVSVGDAASLQWNWSFGNGQTASVQDPPAQSYPTDGNFPLILSVLDQNGCTDTVAQTVVIHPQPTTNAGGSRSMCQGQTVQLQATGADTYVWESTPYLSCTTCSNPIANPPADEKFLVTGSTIYGCTTNDLVQVYVIQPPALITIGDTSICIGQSITLRASGAQQFTWTPADSLTNSNTATPVAIPSSTTTYTVTATDSLGCFTASKDVVITVNANPTVNAGPDIHTGVSIPTPINITNSNDVITWSWEPPTYLNCDNCEHPITSPLKTTDYIVTVTNAGHCSASDTITVFVSCADGNVFLPNTFSPNNDGVNDVFYPRGTGINLIKSLRIFNRWGEVMYEQFNFNVNEKSKGWYGTFHGQQLAPDAFVYICEVICNNNEVITIKGDVTLIR